MLLFATLSPATLLWIGGSFGFGFGFLVAAIAESGRRRQLKEIRHVLATTPRGIFKAIDQNRELMEHLQVHAPALIGLRPWVAVWIRDNDILLTELAKVADMRAERCISGSRKWPRPWPGSAPFTRGGESDVRSHQSA